jgi:hypothetical protein
MVALLKPYTNLVAPLLRLQANSPAYHQLKLNHTLRLALAQKTIVEFPVVLVVLQRDLHSYHVLKPGER